jgi:hypothetical protein
MKKILALLFLIPSISAECQTVSMSGDVTNNNTENGFGYPSGGSRVFQWGWNPVGGSSFFDAALTPNNLALSVQLGTVTISTT